MVRASSTATVWRTLVIGRSYLTGSAVVASIIGMAYWHIVAAAPAITYGDANRTYFKQSAISAGQDTELCFDAVTWHRLCRGELVTWLTRVDGRGSRLDLIPHPISTPLQTGAVAPKCRPWRAPAKMVPGQWKLDGFSRNDCFPREVITNLPSVPLTIQ